MTMLPNAALRALDDILQERLGQITAHGHELEADDDRPVDHLPKLVAEYARIAADRAHPGEHQDLPRARKKLVQVAALALAAIERLDRAQHVTDRHRQPELEI